MVPNLQLAAEGNLTFTLDKMREFMEIYLWRYVVDNRPKMVERTSAGEDVEVVIAVCTRNG